MIEKIKKVSTMIVVTMLLLTGILFLNNSSAHAESLPFDVMPVGKIYQDTGYFRFNVKPNHKYDVPVQIRNLSKKTITISISKLNALTNANGSDYLQYVRQQKLYNARLTDGKRALIKYLNGPKKVILRAGQSKVIHYTLKTPASITEGTLVGALAVKQDGQQAATAKKGKIVIGNQVERVIGIEGDYAKKGKGEVTSGRPQVISTPSAPYLLVKAINNSPRIITHVKMYYTIHQGGKKLFSGKINSFKMAPKSEIGHPAQWNYETFSPGSYTLDMTLDANGQKEERTYRFVIPDKKVKDYQSQTLKKPVAVVQSKLSIFMGIVIGLLLAAVGFVVYIIYRKKREKKD